MAHGSRLVDLVHERIEDFLVERSTILRSISPDLEPLDAFSRRFLSGGKRFRALFCYWGWEAVGARDFDPFAPEGGRDRFPVVSAAAALELFHAAALVHDDIIDNSDTRRGAPSAHRLFEALHGESGWAGSDARLRPGGGDPARRPPPRLERRAARRGARRPPRPHRRHARPAPSSCACAPRSPPGSTSTSSKSVRGSRSPIPSSACAPSGSSSTSRRSTAWSRRSRSAARIAGATSAQLDALRAFGLPLGIAYQLRDDLLGVYGDPEVTGKPSGDDLREGKRTMLVAIARERLAARPAPSPRRTARRPGARRRAGPHAPAHDLASAAPSTRSSGSSTRTSREPPKRWRMPRSAVRRAPSSVRSPRPSPAGRADARRSRPSVRSGDQPSACATRRTSALRPARRAAIGVVPRLSSTPRSHSSASCVAEPGVGEHDGGAVQFGQRRIIAQEVGGHLQHAVDARGEQVPVIDESADAAGGRARASPRGREQSARWSGRHRSHLKPAMPSAAR